jgi:hypothetical protein
LQPFSTCSGTRSKESLPVFPLLLSAFISHQSSSFPISLDDRFRVLGTSARKPPLSDTLLWATLSLAHPFKIEVILSKRVDVLPKQRGCEAQNIVVDHLAFSAELADYIPDVQRIPSNDSVVQDRQTTERVDLIAELTSPARTP